MSLTLHLDTEAWRAHMARVAAETPGLVPVAKGNGYGYGLPRLAAEAERLGADTLAVGISGEAATVRMAGWQNDIVVLTPWTPDDAALLADTLVVPTIGRLDDLHQLVTLRPDARIILEVMTSMRRHGLQTSELAEAVAIIDAAGATLEGFTIHLPMVAGGRLAEARQLADAALAVRRAPLWLSHLDADEYRELSASVGVPTRLRMGTKLWLGAPATRSVTARVLDVHRVERGERIGYWQRRMPRSGSVVVVSGGTANGIAMEAPTAAANPRQRLIAAATGSLEALGLSLSPYSINRRKRFFVEPPHMQSSLVFVPGGEDAGLAVGDEVPVEARLTTVTFDQIIG